MLSNAQQIPKKAATLLQLLKSLIFGIKTEEEEGEEEENTDF